MTSALVWTLVLLTLLAFGSVGAVRAVLRRVHRDEARSGAVWLAQRADAARDFLRSARPVNLETWPEAIAAQAVRAARPVPGGRTIARAYQVRCGSGLFAVAADHAAVLTERFEALMLRCVADDSVRPRIRFVYDESLPPEAYRLDIDVACESPLGPASGTMTYTAPRRALPGAADGVAPAASPWFLRAPDGRCIDIPESGTVVIGTDAGCDLVLADGFVSGRHARISVDDGRLVVRDGAAADPPTGSPLRASTNGTFLRDHPVSTVTVDPADAGVTLRLGPHTALELCHVDPGGVTQPMLVPVVSVRPRWVPEQW